MSTMTTRPSLKSPSIHRSTAKVSTTPLGLPARTPASVGQAAPPLLTPGIRSPKAGQSRHVRTPSPNYFGFIVESSNPPDSNPGQHARQNWNYAASPARTTTSPNYKPVAVNSEFDAFRRQSESNNAFRLHQSSLSSFSSSSQDQSSRNSPTPSHKRPPPQSPVSHSTRRGSPPKRDDDMDIESDDSQPKSFFDLPRDDPPSSASSSLTIPDIRTHRASVPSNAPSSSEDERLMLKKPTRSGTLPPSGVGATNIMPAADVANLVSNDADSVLLLDLRVFPQYSSSHIRGALNLCVPSTLIKRPSFNIQKLMDTFTSDAEKSHFSKWQLYKHIIVYDTNSTSAKEAIAPTHVLKKFVNEGYNGHTDIIKGGFLEFSRKYPDLVEKGRTGSGGSNKQTLSLAPPGPDVAPVIGGCPMPIAKSAANPFFSNIRQNVDLIGGVGQMPIKRPDGLSVSENDVPIWLQSAADESNEGKGVSEKFLEIEKTEQRRMQEALSAQVTYGDVEKDESKPVQIAGIEKGSKNRYNNIFPYDHSRVQLQDTSDNDCDYVNANHVKAEFSNKHYVATQAPIPATFADFWRVVWEQDIRVIVMLTAETEGGQVKAHPYWHGGEYGPFRLKNLSEKKVPLNENTKAASLPNPAHSALNRPGIGQRRSTNPLTIAEKTRATEEVKAATEAPYITVRHLTLSHSQHPFQPMHEITQIQYSSWPDFGAPPHARDLLQLIRHTDRYVRNSMRSGRSLPPDQPMPEDQRPILVHCSAGCGRTGTFCTVDSVIDMMKRQRLSDSEPKSASTNKSSQMDLDTDEQDWLGRRDIDLIAKTVEDLRCQRLSMVQSLRQFVLCYESVLEWIASEPEKSDSVSLLSKPSERKYSKGHGSRRSFGG